MNTFLVSLFMNFIIFAAATASGPSLLPDARGNGSILLLRSLGITALDNYEYSLAVDYFREALTLCDDVHCRIRLLAQIVDAESQSLNQLSAMKWCVLYDSLRETVESLLPGDPRWADPDASALPLLEGAGGGGRIYTSSSGIYLALHRAAEECGRYEDAWRYQSKGLDMRMIEKSLSSKMLSHDNWLMHLSPSVNVFMTFKDYKLPVVSMNYPIFLVGMPRSVISLVNNILGNHNEIYSLPMEPAQLMSALGGRMYKEEAKSPVLTSIDSTLQYFDDILSKNMSDAHKLELIGSYLSDRAVEIAKRAFGIHQYIHKNDAKRFFVDLIAENTHLIGLIHMLYPDALILNCVVDPMDAFVVGLNDETHSPVDAPWIHSRYHQSKCIAISANMVEMYRENLPPGRITDISVSSLLDDPQSVLEAAVLRPLGLAWQEGMERRGAAGPLLARLRRMQGRARKYVDHGDISVYQSSMFWHFQNVNLPRSGEKPYLFPFPDSIDWSLGEQVQWRHIQCDDMHGVEIPKKRDDIGSFLNRLGLEIGAELGVQGGVFSEITLEDWRSCKKYYLIDVWKQQTSNYLDSANVNDREQEKLYQETKKRLRKFEDRTELVYIRDFTSNAVHSIPDGSLDYVYIDARHDYCSVTEDLELYWPKLRPGGIVAGHDYMLGHALKEFIPGEFSDRFDLCPNGKVNNRSVKGAVDDFAKMKGLNVALTFHDFPPFLSFLLRKPCVHSGIRGAKSEL